jgi:NTE family protein
MPTISPYYYPSRGQDLLRSMLEKHVDFGRINDLVKQGSPLLLVGAANVFSGEFKAFSSHRDKINADMILASAAIPTLFRPCTRTGACTGTVCFRKTRPCASFPMQYRNRTRSG